MGTFLLLVVLVTVLLVDGLVILSLVARDGASWGATAEELSAAMPGDALLSGGRADVRLRMTRAISVPAPPDVVWPWVAQIGRGAGWYAIDRLDNGGRSSARHLVSWIPEPALGDASAIGYLAILEPGQRLVWWAPEDRWLGCAVRMAVEFRLRAESGGGARLVARVSADARGRLALPVGWLFEVIDSIMARRQLLGLGERVCGGGSFRETQRRGETGARDQYQLYEVIYASGERAGVAGREHAARWRERAEADGILAASKPGGGDARATGAGETPA